ncbi:MAG: hypothetical protein KatS3mg065_0245 [Chloroflexota bacterium]|nr:MAG: hypothetical protein KatS3mg065_0245 [Chloroflexota bacterium]
MGAIAGRRAIAVAGLDPDDIDIILVATLTPDYWMPSTAALVKEAIGNTTAAAMDVAAACSGFVYAFATAQAYVTAGLARHVLVVGSELLTRFLDYTDRSTCILFGDGAGAVVVSGSDEPGGALGIELTTEPSGAYMIWLPAGGAAAPPSHETVDRRQHFIRMEGRETYRFATRTLAASALAAIERAGWRPEDIDLFIPHQANIRIIESVAKGLGLPMEKMFVNLDRYGNTSAASVPIALAEAVDAGPGEGRRPARLRRLRGGLHVGGSRPRVDGRPDAGAVGGDDPPRGRPGPAADRLGCRRPDPAGVGRGPRPTGTGAARSRGGRARRRPGRRPRRLRCGARRRPRRGGLGRVAEAVGPQAVASSFVPLAVADGLAQPRARITRR